MRRALRLVGWTLLTVIAVLVAGLALSQTQWARDQLLGVALSRANNALHAQLSIGRLGGSLFYGAVLDDVSLTVDGVPAFEAKQVEVRYDPFMLARRQLVLSEVILRAPRIHLIQTATGWNVNSILKPPARPGGAPTRFRITHLGATGALVTITPKSGPRRTLRDVAFDARLAKLDEGLSLDLDRLMGHDEPSGYDIRALSGTFERSFADIDANFDLVRGASRAAGHLSGRREGTGRALVSTVDLTELDLSALLEGDRWKSDITGQATLRATLPERAPASIAFTFAGPRAAAMGYEGQDLDLTGNFGQGVLAFKGSARAYAAAVRIDATWQFADDAARRPWRFRGRGAYEHLQMTRLPAQLKLPQFDTNLAGSFVLAVDPSGWMGQTELRASRFEGAELGRATKGELRSARGRLTYRATGTVKDLNLQRLASPLELSLLAQGRFEGTLNGSFEAEGRGTRPSDRWLHASAVLADSRLGKTRTASMNTELTLAGSRLDIRAAGDFADLTEVTAGLPASMVMNLNGATNVWVVIHDFNAPFTVEALDVSGQVTLGPSTVREQPITAAVIDGDLVDGIASLRTLTAEAPNARLSAQGTVALGSTGESALTVTASSDDLARFSDLVGQTLAGAADLKADVTGPSARPKAQGTLNGRQLAYGTRVSALNFDSNFTAEVPDRDFNQVKADGTFNGAFMKLAGFDVVRMAGTATLDGRELTLDTKLEETQRTVEVGGVIGFEPANQTVTLRRAQIAAGETVWALPPGQEARLGLGGDRIRVTNLTLLRDAQRVDVSGELALEPAGESASAGLTITASGVRVADINSLLLGDRAFGGTAEGTVLVRGSVKAPVVEGEIRVVDASVNDVRFEQARATVQYARSVATIDAELVQTAQNRLTVKGTVPTSGAAMDLRVTSTPVDLAFAQAFTSEITGISGQGVFDLHVTGPRSAPIVDGTVALDDGGFAVDATGVTYSGLTARLEFNRGHMDVRSFRVLDDAGHELRAEGGLDVLGSEGPRAMHVRIFADGFRVLNNRFGSAAADVELRADGDLAAPKIVGRLRVAGGRIEVDRVLETTSKSVYSTKPQVPDEEIPTTDVVRADGAVIERVGPDPSRETFFGRLDLALQLELPDDLVLRGRDLRAGGSFVSLGDMNIVAGGNLDLQKRPGGALTTMGSLEVVRGYYSFQGRRFDVQRESAVRFQGRVPLDPALNVRANRLISGVDASVHVGGTLREPTIDLSSRPSLEDADILSLIVFGQPVNDLGSAQRTSLTDRAASMAAGALTSPLSDSLARALNLDLFEIQAPTGESAPVVALGSQVGSRLYVGVRQEVGRGDSSLVSVEYRIASVLRLVTSIALGSANRNIDNRKEGSGVDFIFQVRY